MVSFLDLHKINQRFQEEFLNEFKSFLGKGLYIKGEQVAKFEQAFANYCGSAHCIGTANGLDALTLILRAYQHLGKLKKGDKVLVPANTFIATILSVINADMIPVLIEPNEQTYNIDITGIKENKTEGVKAIIAVHLYGTLVDMLPIQAFCETNDLVLIEDAAQAHGALNSMGQRAGDLGDAAAFSFYPAKNLGALGDAGAITTSNTSLSKAIRILGNYGSSKKYIHDNVGVNSRLDEIQAAFLNLKLRILDQDNSKRRAIAKFYNSCINNGKIKLPVFTGQRDQVFYVYAVRVENRDDFVNYLALNGVGSHIHYPTPPNLQNALKSFKFGRFPITESIHRTVVSIPLNPILTDQEIERVTQVLNAY